ncbi:CLUMA_CG010948, isoform A [Clunio marinus]|uniref:CLUMA_CG010948, isoform A n=1 Tax=Clunio marinus TaxID=568069 RepID=A0A1J1ICT2_9DIPT|nr:CLUMA_CG010948, isoform A [Clunio marinus]
MTRKEDFSCTSFPWVVQEGKIKFPELTTCVFKVFCKLFYFRNTNTTTNKKKQHDQQLVIFMNETAIKQKLMVEWRMQKVK